MRSLQEILTVTRFLTEEKKSLIEKAYIFVVELHKEQLRHYSTESITKHATRVAFILAELGMPTEMIIAGLLHHAIREGLVSTQTISKQFGTTVSLLLEGTMRLRDIRYQGEISHLESLRKLFVASAKDMRILVLKLADRLDTMRSLQFAKEHQLRIAQETMEIYAPLARRLGLLRMSREMEDLAFKYISPQDYQSISVWVEKKQKEDTHPFDQFHKSLLKRLAKAGVHQIETDTRLKGIYSIYQKINRKKKEPELIYDLLAIRMRVDTVEDCYRSLGVIHTSWRPLPGRIKDYIAFPKPNGYQSLHTTVFTGHGGIIEIQIRTKSMHEEAEYGLASHLSYKEPARKNNVPYDSWLYQFLPPHKINSEKKYSFSAFEWLQKMVQDEHGDAKDADNFTSLRSDFFQYRMFIFDTHGEVVDLPIHSTPIDFAYEIGVTSGNHLYGAKVNGKLVHIDAELKNGDIVEIVTKQSSHPTVKWLLYAKTILAKKLIQEYLASKTTLSQKKKTSRSES